MDKPKLTKAVYVLLALAAVVAVCLLYNRPGTPVFRSSGEGGASAVIFVPGKQGKLVRKTVEVQRQLPDRAKADAIFRELKEGRSIPDRLRLYEMAVGEDGVLYLNLSKEFLDPGTPAREVTMVYSLVDSFLASFPRAKRVQLLVEGAPVYTRSGFLYILEPLEFNKELLEE
jgi:spore germination protein GerM